MNVDKELEEALLDTLQDIVFSEDIVKMNNRFSLEKDEMNEKGWFIYDKLHNVVYSFSEKDYFNTLVPRFAYGEDDLSYEEKMRLKDQMESWLFLVHSDLIFPNELFTFKPCENRAEGLFKIRHNVTPIFEVIIKEEGSLKELAIILKKLAEVCEKKDLVIMQ